MPGEPPTTRTVPAVNFVSRAARRGHAAQDRCRRAPGSGRDGREPDVGDDDVAGVEAAGRDDEPDLRPVERHRQRPPGRRPRRPPRSTRRRPRAGRPRPRAARHALIRSISAAASGRGAPWKPVPKSASTTTSQPSGCVRLDRVPTRPRAAPAPRSCRRRRSRRRRRRRRTARAPGTPASPRARPPRRPAPSARAPWPGNPG